jgi:hypothetical protein
MLISAWTKKPLFKKKHLKSRKIIFKIFSVKEKSTYFLVYHPLFGIMPLNTNSRRTFPVDNLAAIIKKASGS